MGSPCHMAHIKSIIRSSGIEATDHHSGNSHRGRVAAESMAGIGLST
jgi:hypothetical protein